VADNYVFIRDLAEQARPPASGILSQTLHNDERTKIVLFGFAAGEELSAHAAPFPAVLTFIKGEAALRLGSDEEEAAAGTYVFMNANLEHGIKAKTGLVVLLTMLKR